MRISSLPAATTFLLAACAAEPQARPSGGDTVSAAAVAAAADTGRAEPIRSADDVTAHQWQELERRPETGEWFVPAPGLALAFPADEPAGGAAADDADDPARALEIHPNRRTIVDGRPLAERSVLTLADVRVEDGAAVLALRESWRRADLLGTRDVRVRVSPAAQGSGVYRWEFSYASPDPCAGRDPCGLARPLWVGALGTRYFERVGADEAPPLDQTEPVDAPVSGGG